MKVYVVGCDGVTIVEVDATEEQRQFLERLVKATEEASTYACEPVVQLSWPADK